MSPKHSEAELQLLQDKTIRDYSIQWTRYHDLDGWTGSMEFFSDVMHPFVSADDVVGKYVAEIGSGPGRIVLMLIEAGARHVMAVEPSDAMSNLMKHTEHVKDKVTYLKVPGDQIPRGEEFDFVFAIGVIMFIPDPNPTISAALKALKPNGRIVVWLYGKEGNEAFLAIAIPLRKLTSRLPHRALAGLCWLLTPPLWLYIRLCRVLPLPMRSYMRNVLAHLYFRQLQVDIYDQLNPTYCKYYSREEAVSLLENNGFVDVKANHRHSYSWTVVGTKPVEQKRTPNP